MRMRAQDGRICRFFEQRWRIIPGLRHRRLTEAFGKSRNIRVRFCAELLAQQLFVHTCVTNRPGAIAGRFGCAHQGERYTRVGRIRNREPTPRRYGICGIATLLGGPRQLLQCIAE